MTNDKEDLKRYFNLSPDEELDEAWAAFEKLGPVNMTKVMCHLSRVAQVTETKFFQRFARAVKHLEL
jgi:hypothetical protein